MPDSPQYRFPEMPAADDLLQMLEALKSALIGWPQEEFDGEYRRIRRLLTRHPMLKNSLPEFLRTCRDINDCRAYLQKNFETEFAWDVHVRESLAPLFSHLD